MLPFTIKAPVTASRFGLLTALPAAADPLSFSTGNVTNFIATASRPQSAGKFEIESADDFDLTSPTPSGVRNIHWFDQTATLGVTPTTGEVVVEIYRVFPALSDVNRTSGPLTFSTSQVPTRVNSPSDVEHDGRATSSGDLTFTTKVPGNTFTALNSVQPNGIHPTPNQTTSGNGPVTGQEVEFYVNFSKSFDFSPDHYFFGATSTSDWR